MNGRRSTESHSAKMPLLLNLTAAVLLLITHCGSWSLASRLGPHKICPSCKDSRASRDPAGAANTAVLALGEPCGVYTLSCAKGLRCMPPPRDHSPLQALLQGRGVCTKQIRTSPTEKPHTAGPHPSHSGEIEKAPCRKLLNAVLRGLELTVFQSDRDIYIPNCDTRGFYRKKQCRSSKGMQRGHCWCVDELGITIPSDAGEDGALPCDGE